MAKCIPFGWQWNSFNVAFNDQINVENKFSQMIRIFGSVLYYVIILYPFDIRLDIMKPSLGSIVLWASNGILAPSFVAQKHHLYYSQLT